MDSMRGLVGSFGFLVALGFQVSGYQNLPLAFALWGIAGIVAAYEFVTWTPIRRRLIRVDRKNPMISLTAAIVIGAIVGGAAFGTIWHLATRNSLPEASSKVPDAVRLAERANLRIDKWSVSLRPGKVPDINFQLINSGRSQAEVIEFFVGYKIASEDQIPTFGRGDSQVALPAIVGPNSAVDVAAPIPESLTEDEFREIMARRKFIFLVGETSYRDIFNWTCTIRFGAQIGIHGDGKLGVTFIGRPGYNFVKWSEPTEKLEAQRKYQAMIAKLTELSSEAQTIEQECWRGEMGCIARFKSWNEKLSTYMHSNGEGHAFVQSDNQSMWTMPLRRNPALHPEIQNVAIWLQAKQWFLGKWIDENKQKLNAL
ncbi:MAG: hypothetical protein Q7N50_08560 [Armatimonadota bacterium]|nr:hypothetical protein [Armatimonadota bacterium]